MTSGRFMLPIILLTPTAVSGEWPALHGAAE